VHEVGVVGAPDPDLGQVVVAFVVADDVDAGTLIEFAGTRLARHKVPRRVHFVAALPRNELGKILKSELLGSPAER
jgi:fatty acid CoA ligase FadD36